MAKTTPNQFQGYVSDKDVCIDVMLIINIFIFHVRCTLFLKIYIMMLLMDMCILMFQS